MPIGLLGKLGFSARERGVEFADVNGMSLPLHLAKVVTIKQSAE